MTPQLKFDIIKEMVTDYNRVCGTDLTCEFFDSTDTIEIRPSHTLYSSFLLKLAALCSAFNWSFFIANDFEYNRPYIHILK